MLQKGQKRAAKLLRRKARRGDSKCSRPVALVALHERRRMLDRSVAAAVRVNDSPRAYQADGRVALVTERIMTIQAKLERRA